MKESIQLIISPKYQGYKRRQMLKEVVFTEFPSKIRRDIKEQA
jgi:hypothetical protein